MNHNSTDSAIRIGPRKLRRVFQYEADSISTPSPSASRSYGNRSRMAKPTTIEGGAPRSKQIVREPQSYFELPREGRPRSPSSLITPISFMNASTTSPETPSSSGQNGEKAAEQRSSGSERHSGNMVLLVEDNVINMRVSLPVAVFESKLIVVVVVLRPIPLCTLTRRASTDHIPALDCTHEKAKSTIPVCPGRPRSTEQIYGRPSQVLLDTDGYEHASYGRLSIYSKDSRIRAQA